MKTFLKGVAGICSAALMGIGAPAHAELLTPSDERSLAAWLGQGPISLNTLYAKQADDDAADFHAAVDNKGKTIFVAEVTTKAGASFLVGGYNPQSWNSGGGYTMTSANNDRTAFLFNLSTGALHRQMLRGVGTEQMGAYQTFNDSALGPTFGSGHDFSISEDLDTGYSLLYSYADDRLGNLNRSIADNALYKDMDDLYIGQLEVYSVAVVPEPAQVSLLLAGIAVVAVARRKKR
jgi:hypothetical protein